MLRRFQFQIVARDFIFSATCDPQQKNSGEETVTLKPGRTYQNGGIAASRAGVQHMNDRVAR
jgi:hypothetical protein